MARIDTKGIRSWRSWQLVQFVSAFRTPASGRVSDTAYRSRGQGVSIDAHVILPCGKGRLEQEGF